MKKKNTKVSKSLKKLIFNNFKKILNLMFLFNFLRIDQPFN